MNAASDPRAAVRQYIDAFNEGDGDGMAAVFSISGAILDGMAPHLWQGRAASREWYADVLKEGKSHGASAYCVTFAEALHNKTTGNSAYVVIPAMMTFQLNGRQVTQTGAIFTVALRKLADAWRIAAWAWAKGKQ